MKIEDYFYFWQELSKDQIDSLIEESDNLCYEISTELVKQGLINKTHFDSSYGWGDGVDVSEFGDECKLGYFDFDVNEEVVLENSIKISFMINRFDSVIKSNLNDISVSIWTKEMIQIEKVENGFWRNNTVLINAIKMVKHTFYPFARKESYEYSGPYNSCSPFEFRRNSVSLKELIQIMDFGNLVFLEKLNYYNGILVVLFDIVKNHVKTN
jgi:hypothetical protein